MEYNNYYTTNQAPLVQLKTNRSLIKFILFSLITFGIYPLVLMCILSSDINTIASRHDGRRTMHFLLVCLLTFVTCGIAMLVWYHRFSARIGLELQRRAIPYAFGAGSFWGWDVLGSFILIGPFVYTHKLLRAMNLLSAHYNMHG